MIEYNQKKELPNIITPYKDNVKKIINIYGDSFVFLGMMTHVVKRSWQYYLSQLLSAKINSYGIGGAAESTILYCYVETYKENRDYTIIFHTHPSRSDNFFNLDDLTIENYKKWDKSLNIHPVLHIYWTDAEHYMFENGKMFYCNYWMEDYSKKVASDEDWEESSDYLPSDRQVNHMTDAGNFQLALDIYKPIKNELIDEYT